MNPKNKKRIPEKLHNALIGFYKSENRQPENCRSVFPPGARGASPSKTMA